MGQAIDSSNLPAGHVIGGKYQVVRRLGVGGMGAVYEAENTWTTRRVAIKLLQASIAGDQEVVQRFRREAVAATKLAHPNIVDVLDMGEDAETKALFLVQEFLEGRDLRAHLDDRKRLPPAEALDLLVPVVAALTAAHKRGILHRDLKPENVFLVRAGGGAVVPKVIDFGLAKFLGEGEVLTMTRTGAVMGTPYYMSPEQVRGERSVDGRADIWAMGAVLYELLAGRPPFDAPNYNMLMFKIHTERPPRIETVLPEVPPALAEVIHKALEPEVEDRTPSMGALLEALVGCAYLPGNKVDAGLRERHRAVIERALDAPRTSEVPGADEPAKQPQAAAVDDALAHTLAPSSTNSVRSSAAPPTSLAGKSDTPGPAAPEPEGDASSRHATPFGWNHNSQPDTGRRNTKRAALAGVGAVALVGVLVAAKALSGGRPAPTHAGPTPAAAIVAPPPTASIAPAPIAAPAPTQPAPVAAPVAAVTAPVVAEPEVRGHRRRRPRGTGEPARPATSAPAAGSSHSGGSSHSAGGGDLLVPVGESR